MKYVVLCKWFCKLIGSFREGWVFKLLFNVSWVFIVILVMRLKLVEVCYYVVFNVLLKYRNSTFWVDLIFYKMCDLYIVDIVFGFFIFGSYLAGYRFMYGGAVGFGFDFYYCFFFVIWWSLVDCSFSWGIFVDCWLVGLV